MDLDKLITRISALPLEEKALLDFLNHYEEHLEVVFEWSAWDKKDNVLKKSFDYTESSIEDLRKYLTVIVRADRFTEGFLDSKLNDGTVIKILQSLKVKI